MNQELKCICEDESHNPDCVYCQNREAEFKAEYDREKGKKFYQVVCHGLDSGIDSKPFKTLKEAERYVNESLPYGTQKCRTGSYEIVETDKEGNEL